MSNISADEPTMSNIKTDHEPIQNQPTAADIDRLTKAIDQLRQSLSPSNASCTVANSWPKPLREVCNWLNATGRWTRSLTLLGIGFAIAFGVFAPMSWALSKDSYRLAKLANMYAHQSIQISAYEYALSVFSNDLAKYSNDLSRIANEIARQSRDDGRLSNRLTYLSICLSNPSFFPELCTRIVNGDAKFKEHFAGDFNASFPPTGSPGSPTDPVEKSLEPPPDPYRNPPPQNLPRDLVEEPTLQSSLSTFPISYLTPAIVGASVVLPLSVLLMLLAA